MDFSERPIVSVILCVRNGADTVRRQLDALDSQVGAPEFEVVVVENGSTDSTAAVVKKWITASRGRMSLFRMIDGSARLGIPAARNQGAAASRGSVLAFCDADDRVSDDWVRAMFEAVSTDLLAGGRLVISESSDRVSRDFGQGLVSTNYLPHVSGANFAIARRVFFAVRGFDESLPKYGFDDVDFSWRVQKAGFPIIYVPDAAVDFTLSGASASLKKRFALGRGRVLMAYRFPAYDPTRYTVASTLRDAARAAVDLASNSIRKRKLDRQAASRFFAGLGRVSGAVAYRSGRRLPERKLLSAEEGQ